MESLPQNSGDTILKLIPLRGAGLPRFVSFDIFDELVKTLNLLANVIPALDNNTQGQAAAGIQ
jgi:hypothetical protein